MRKHILGFAIFNVIVISFGLVFAFLNAPAIPKRDEVKQPLLQSKEPAVKYDYRSRCRKNQPEQTKQFSSEIISSNYFFNENKIVSKIRVSLENGAKLPEKLYVSANYSIAGKTAPDGFGDRQVIENPFNADRERIITIVSPLSGRAKIDAKDNLFVAVNVGDDSLADRYKTKADFTQVKEVLFVHGKSR